MQKKYFNQLIIPSIFFIAIFLRLSIFLVSPPNNSFDDHLEVVNFYATNFSVPMPQECWECYQPPLYYFLGAVFLKVSEFFNLGDIAPWKLVQLINPILSVLSIVLIDRIFKIYSLPLAKRIFYLTLFSILPIDLLTSSMIGNDYLLVFLSIVAFYMFLVNMDDLKRLSHLKLLNYSILTFVVLLACFTKQHGMLLLVFPSIPLFWHLNLNRIRRFNPAFFVYMLLLIVAFGFELWKFNISGKFLVSNQDFYNFADGQFPGQLSKVEFFSFDVVNLFEKPFLSNSTAASLPTEVFARTFFDYEWRFLNPKNSSTLNLGRFAYFYGIILIMYLIVSFVLSVRLYKSREDRSKIEYLILLTSIAVGLLFFLVPFLQTLRFPYFSSMKATFALPGIIILLIFHALFVDKYQFKNINLFLTGLNLIFGFLLVFAICEDLPNSINHLSGPMWAIP